MILDYARQTGSWLLCLSGLGLVSTQAHAETAFDTRTDTDYIAIVVEAEDHVSKDDRWVLTEPDTPAQEDDPDPNHSDLAVGQAYLELLPDVRVTHEDSFGPPTAAWFTPGTGPRAEYLLDFPEAGRYYVHVRAFSTGTEDNGLHIGLNGDFPDSGKNLQFCTAQNRAWSWSGRQRDSGATGSCGVRKTIWVTVEEAGEQTFMISAREDGFEIDRFMLIKDLSDNTRICEPQNEDEIKCVNGSVENVDDIVDMGVTLERHDSEADSDGAVEGEAAEDDVADISEDTDIDITESVDIRATVRNLDSFDTAQDVVLTLEVAPDSDWQLQAIPEDCELQEAGIVCELGNLEPSGRDGELLLDFSFTPLRSGELPIAAAIVTSSVDDGSDNDTASMVFNVSDEGSLSNLSVRIVEPIEAWQAEAQTPLNFSITNNGPATAEDVTLALSMPTALSVTGVPEGCVLTATLRCDFETLEVDELHSFVVQLSASEAGLYSINIVADALNLDMNSEQESADTIIVTVEAAEEVPVEPEPEDTTEENPEEPDPDDTTGENPTDSSSDEDNDTPVASKSSSGGSSSVWMLSLLAMSLLTKGVPARTRTGRIRPLR